MTLTPPALDHRPTDTTNRAVVLLHAKNHSPGEMRDLAAAIGMLDWRGVFPAVEGSSWYPCPFNHPLDDNEPALSAAVERIAAEVDRLAEEGFKPENVAVGGFSQGACVVAEYLSRVPTRHRGIILLSGALPGPDGLARTPPPAVKGVPALVTGSRADPFMPCARVEATAEWLRAGGAKAQLVLHETRGHQVDEDEIATASQFVDMLEQM